MLTGETAREYKHTTRNKVPNEERFRIQKQSEAPASPALHCLRWSVALQAKEWIEPHAGKTGARDDRF